MFFRRSESARREAGFIIIAVLSAFFVVIGAHAQVAPSAGTPECADGIDNDGDGTIDALATGGNPSATATLGLGNPFAIRAIVNAGGYGIPDSGAIFRDAATVNKVCQIQGYAAASGSDCTAPPYDNRCGWRSFGDNTMWAWNGSTFYSIRNNVWTSTVTCVGLPAPCGDGKDNDGDGKIDLADDGCANVSDASEVKHDPECANRDTPKEGVVKQCNDRLDNDGDGRFDFDGGDPGCADGNDDDESNDPVPVVCPEAFSCGVEFLDDAEEQCSADGKGIEWSTGGEECTLANGATGSCFKCVDPPDDGGNDGGGDDGGDMGGDADPPPMCPVGCNVDADCGDEPQCAKEQNPDGTYTGNDKCWEQDNVCVKKCKVPRCIDNKCTMAAPADIPTAPYLPCEGQNACPAPRCGDGVVQPAPDLELPVPDDGAADTGGDVCNVTGTSCEGMADARACKEPYCVDVNGREIQGTSCTCPAQQAGNECSADYPVCPLPGHRCPQGQTFELGQTTCTSNGDTVRCGRCAPLNCSNGYRPVGPGPISPVPNNCAGGWYIQGANNTCNCIMAAAGASPTATTASVIQGSSLLATSIVNNCSTSCLQSFVGSFCGAGDACFALMGANSAQQRCLPADCADRRDDADCNIIDPRWAVCAGTAVAPDDGGAQDPDAPVGEPVPEDGEECDDGNNDGNDGCSPTCKKEACGDGAVQEKGADGKPNTEDDELCDDGNRDLGDGCSNTCKVEECGDGKIDYGEECDDGEDNADEAGACRMDCTLPKCNDGIVDDVAPWGEQCDCGEEGANFDWEANKDDAMSPYCEVEVDGKPAICHMGMCKAQYCGDGFAFNPGFDRVSGTADDEMCDAGPLNSDFAAGGDKCETSAQCAQGICVDEACVQKSCQTSAECGDGACIGGSCVKGGCETTAQCPVMGNSFGLNANECVSGSCRKCDDHSQCASGWCSPSGTCVPKSESQPAASCRMDCKAVRCGDGVVDEGEICDEGEAMFKCNGFPQPACDCAVPSWGSHLPGVGPFNTTCCPENQYCSVWPTATCPADCGVAGDGVGGRGMCGNHQLNTGEECDTSVPGWQGPNSDWADAQVDYAYRPNRDGTRSSFIEDDGNWKASPSSIEQKFTTIDHSPVSGSSPDSAYIVSSGEGTARTYFHLWDIPLTESTTFSFVRLRLSADFTGKGTGWAFQELPMPIIQVPGRNFTAVDMNAAVLEIVADESAHTLTFVLYHATTGIPLSRPLVVASPTAPAGRSAIAIDAVEIAAFGTSLDVSYSCEECVIVRCGNKKVETGEACDDGNAEGGDGCSERCEEEICKLPGA